jgi:hypothetical protein
MLAQALEFFRIKRPILVDIEGPEEFLEAFRQLFLLELAILIGVESLDHASKKITALASLPVPGAPGAEILRGSARGPSETPQSSGSRRHRVKVVETGREGTGDLVAGEFAVVVGVKHAEDLFGIAGGGVGGASASGAVFGMRGRGDPSGPVAALPRKRKNFFAGEFAVAVRVGLLEEGLMELLKFFRGDDAVSVEIGFEQAGVMTALVADFF